MQRKRPLPLRHAAAAAASTVLLMTACGGGGSPARPDLPGDNGTGAATGPVSGLGSILVNGIRFDDRTARVLDDEGAPSSASALKLGMMAAVTSGAITPASGDTPGRATATQIVYGSSIEGRVTARNLATSPATLTVAGQNVLVPPGTMFDGFSGLSAVTTSEDIEVHAVLNANTGQHLATRIVRRPDLTACKVVGIATGVDPTSRSFVLGGLAVSYSGATVSGLSDNARVRVTLTRDSGTQTCTNAATSVTAAAPRVVEGARTVIEGYVSGYVDSTRFRVNGVPVQTGGATSGLGIGSYVEAEGVVQSGVLNAGRIVAKNPLAARELRLYGAASNLDTVNQTFVLRGVTVFYPAPPGAFENGASETSLNDGTLLEVRGVMDATLPRLVATRIRRQD